MKGAELPCHTLAPTMWQVPNPDHKATDWVSGLPNNILTPLFHWSLSLTNKPFTTNYFQSFSAAQFSICLLCSQLSCPPRMKSSYLIIMPESPDLSVLAFHFLQVSFGRMGFPFSAALPFHPPHSL